MRPLPSRLLVGTAAVTLTLFGLSGCGSEEPKDRDPATQTTETVAEAPTQTPEDATALEEPAPGASDLTRENLSERVVGAMADAGSVHMVTTMYVPEQGESPEMVMNLSWPPQPGELYTAHISMVDEAEEFGMIVLDGDIYFKITPVTGDKWLLVDESMPSFDEMIEQMKPVDPRDDIGALGNAILEFEAEPDAEIINGISTTKVTLLVDTLKYRGPEKVATLGDTVTMIMFVGPDDLPVRQIIETEENSIVVDMSRWGEPLNLSAPNDDEIVTFADLSPQQ